MEYVKDVMIREIIALKSEDSLRNISKVLTEKQVSNLPVVNSKKELIGVVSEQDIIKAMESKNRHH